MKNEKAFGYGVMSRTDEENAITVFDEYVDGYKLQGREIPYDYMYNIIFPYVEDYYNDKKL